MNILDHIADPQANHARAVEYVKAAVAWHRRDAAMASNSGAARKIRSVGIIGAGVMGAELAAAHIKRHLPVTITDANPDALATIADRTTAELAAATEPLAASDNQHVRALIDRLLHPTGELAQVARCDLVIESITEKLSAKQKLFDSLQKHISPETIVASNTSTIPIGKLAECIPWPERFCGAHFFHPVLRRPLLEIIRTRQTGHKTISAVMAYARTIDKLPIVVADGPGFLVNRLLLPYLTEAMELLMEGASMELIEQTALNFGMAKGPFCLMDEIGLDTTLHAGWSLAEAFPERIAASPLLVTLIKSGRLGKKSGAGFFSYADQSSSQTPTESDPAVIEIIARWAKPCCQHSPEDIIRRLLLPMVLEATRILEEGNVQNPLDIDLGAIFGLGFPDWRGGLLCWADTLGALNLLEMLRPLAPIGPRLQPTRYLLNMGARGGRFFPQVGAPVLPALTLDMPLIPGSAQLIE